MSSSIAPSESSPDNTLVGVKVICVLLSLSGAALVTSWLWPSPFLIFILISLFPFSFNLMPGELVYSYTVRTTFALAVCYGTCELIIALGMWRMHDRSRKALLGLSSLWVVCGILDTTLLLGSFSGALFFYYVGPIVVVYAVIGAVFIFYMHRESIREYFMQKVTLFPAL